MAAAAAARGWNCYMFDGPGQGLTLFDRKVVMRPDWENVLPAVVDVLQARADVDGDRMALMGRSLGGYLAPRAASGEHRFAALVVDPGQHDIGASFWKRLPDGMMEHLDDASPESEAKWQGLLDKPVMKRFFAPRMATHGTTTVRSYVQAMMDYRLDDLAADITCPTLVCENETDLVSGGQGQALYDMLHCPKDYIRFTVAEGAGGHCEGVAPNLFYGRAFDWLDTIIED